MWPDRVVFLLPDTDYAFGVVQGVKLVDSEAFVAEFPVEGLHEPVSPGLTWGDEHPFCFTGPVSNGAADEHRAVIHAQSPQHAPLQRQDVKLFGTVQPSDRVVDNPAETFPGVFINDGENLDRFACDR